MGIVSSPPGSCACPVGAGRGGERSGMIWECQKCGRYRMARWTPTGLSWRRVWTVRARFIIWWREAVR